MKKNSAFTLTELLAVIALIGILAGILIPVVGAARAKARAVECLSNLRQIGQAMILYSNEHKKRFPYAMGYPLPDGSSAPVWANSLAPYLGMQGRLGPPPLARADGVLICPATGFDSNLRSMSYGYNPNIDSRNGSVPSLGIWDYSANLRNPSRLFLLVEIEANHEFCYPSQMTVDGIAYGTKRRHPGNSGNFLFADGHVENITEPTHYNIYNTGDGDPRWIYANAQ